MKCKVCGAFNEDYMEYCEKCAAPLKESPAPAANGSQNSNRGFVRSPVWAKPEFNANTISENDVPADFFNVPANDAKQASDNSDASGDRCNFCGSRLIAGQRFCNSCGAKVGTAPVAVSTAKPYTAPQSSVASSAWTGSSQQTIKYADPIDESTFSFNRLDDDDDYAAPKAKRGAAKPVAQKAAKSGRKPASRRRRAGSSFNFKPVLIAAAAVVVIGLLVFGIIKLVNGGLFNGSAITDPAVIEQTTTQNGDPAYNITIYAKKNSTVRFEGGSITHDEVITKKSVTFSIPEQVWVPNEPIEGTSVTVTPNITVINKKGEAEPVTFEQTITINVPSIDMTVTSPNTEQFSASSPAVEIAGMVGDTTAGIFVNDEPVPVDETGSFSYTYTLTQPGTNTVNVEARKNGYAINRKTFTIEYGSTSTGNGTANSGGASTGSNANAGGAQSVYYATTSDVNVRATASASGDKLGSLKLCEKVYVVSADDNQWYKIVYNGGDAYVSGQYIKRVCSVSEYNPTPATISGDDINARAAASTSADKVDTLKNGTSVSLISQDSNGWSLVEYNNRIFYVSSSYVKK